jgi:hypothetical protein
MSDISSSSGFNVNIMVHAAGPVRPRTKYKDHKLLRAEGSITLPFVPYPGLFLMFSKPKKRGQDLTVYLRVRAVMWNIAEQLFECVADEIVGSSLFDDMHEVRGSARIEQHFIGLEKALRTFGFGVITDADGQMALHKREDGIPYERLNPGFSR